MKGNMEKNATFNDWIREFYDNEKQKMAKKNYEYFRWFSTNKKLRQYGQTIKSLNFHLKDINFSKCLDIGCGPGTWTFMLMEKLPKAKFTCIDISKEMLSQFQSRVNNNNVKFVISAFTDFQTKEKYDFIFCSRSIEYMQDKSLVVKKMRDLLSSNGKGIIITSPPHPILLKVKKILGKKENLQHTKRLSIREMKLLLQNQGFINIEFYPILFTDYLPEIINHFTFNNYYKKHSNLFSNSLASSYLVKFEKP